MTLTEEKHQDTGILQHLQQLKQQKILQQQR
ncbi:unnamed protein product, partial [Allacma fusca]